MSYYKCEGVVTVIDSITSQCSTGWLVVDEPTFTLVTREQAVDLIVSVLLLIALYKVFSIILKSMGF